MNPELVKGPWTKEVSWGAGAIVDTQSIGPTLNLARRPTSKVAFFLSRLQRGNLLLRKSARQVRPFPRAGNDDDSRALQNKQTRSDGAHRARCLHQNVPSFRRPLVRFSKPTAARIRVLSRQFPRGAQKAVALRSSRSFVHRERREGDVPFPRFEPVPCTLRWPWCEIGKIAKTHGVLSYPEEEGCPPTGISGSPRGRSLGCWGSVLGVRGRDGPRKCASGFATVLVRCLRLEGKWNLICQVESANNTFSES